MIRVAIIDDHFVVRIGIKAILGLDADIEIVGEASGGRGAAKFVLDLNPDVLLLDIRMPDCDGLAALKEILSVRPEQKVVMLTTSDADNDVYSAIKLGAKGYLVKDRDSDNLSAAIRRVASGGKFIPPEVMEKYHVRQMMSDVTRREMDVLRLLVKGLPNEQIANELGIAYDGVKEHIKHMFVKFDVTNRVALATEALRRGFIQQS